MQQLLIGRPKPMAERYRIVITDLIDDELAPEREALDGVADVEALNATSESELEGQIEQVDGIILKHPNITR